MSLLAALGLKPLPKLADTSVPASPVVRDPVSTGAEPAGTDAMFASPPVRTKGLTANEVVRLVDTLVYLANPRFQRAPGPPKLSLSSPQPAVDGVLEDTAEILRLWSDPKTLPQAVESWRRVEPRLKSLFVRAENPASSVVDSSVLTPARQAVSQIADYLSMLEVDLALEVAVRDTPTAELSQAFDERELREFEPALRGFHDTLRKGSAIADGAGARNLVQVLDVYFSADQPIKRLAALQAAGMLKKGATLASVKPFIIHALSTAVSSIAASAIEAATASQIAVAFKVARSVDGTVEKEAIKAAEKIGKWAEGAARVLGGAAGAYEVYKGIEKLISGIEEGNWHDISEGAAEVGMGAIGLAEAAGVVSTTGFVAGNTLIVVVWGVAEVILSGAELVRWARKDLEQRAFRKFVADMRKLVPLGKRMSAAVELMTQAQSGQDELSANNYARYESIAGDLEAELIKQLDVVIDKHIRSNDKSYIGGYPVLIAPLLRAVDSASRQIVPGAPQSVASAFDGIVVAIQAIVAHEDATNALE